MIQDVFVVDAAAHSYNLREDNYAVGSYSQAVRVVLGLEKSLELYKRTQS